MKVRRTVQIGIRCLSLAMVIPAVAILTRWVIVLIRSWVNRRPMLTLRSRPVSTWEFLGRKWDEFYFSNEAPWVVSLLLLALALWFAQKRLARLVVPDLGRTCPECGYSLRHRKEPGCPECGAGVSPSPPDSGQSSELGKESE